MNRIADLQVTDVRFPTSENHIGADAANQDPDYSAAYIVLRTTSGAEGFALVFTIGRGNDLCCQAIESMRHLVLGRDLDVITRNFGEFSAELMSDSQLRWLGPEKGLMHMAAGGILNCVWDLWARSVGKPVWRLVCDLSPEQFVDCLDLRYVTDVLTREEALAIIERNEATKPERIRSLAAHGFPAYTSSAGWLGYRDEQMVALCREAVRREFKAVKLKVGRSLEEDLRRCRRAREAIGADTPLFVDANQIWEVDQAIEWVKQLAHFNPAFVEEPTSPDDVRGHLKIKNSVRPIKIASGEHCQNRIMFKQFIESDAIDVVQVDACRLAGLNEMLVVALIAAKYGKPVCPHAGGVGLCEYVQHLSMIDYARIAARLDGRVIEYVDHLHEHFEDPCVIERGNYMPPQRPGFSVKMRPSSIVRYAWPQGPEWQRRRAE